VEVAEGRHGADLAVQEDQGELALRGQAHLAGAQAARHPEQVYPAGRGHDQHHQFAVGDNHDDFGNHAAGDVFAGGNLLRRHHPSSRPAVHKEYSMTMTNDGVGEDIYDITLIGAGPTGLFGAFYAGMRELRTKIIDALPEAGGQLIALYPEKYIFDAPGFPQI